MTTAGEFCSRRVVIARPSESLTDAARRLLDEHVGCVVVVDQNGVPRPIGMLTDRDIVVGVIARTDRHLHSLTVGDVMTTEVVTVCEDEPFEDVFGRMGSFGVRRIPVVNENGGLEGIITFDHWIEFLGGQIALLSSMMVREIRQEAQVRTGQGLDLRGRLEAALPRSPGLRKYTNMRLVVLSPETSAYSAIRALEDNHIGAVIVHDGEGVVGIATDRDLALRIGSYEVDAVDVVLGDVMTTDVATLPATASVEDAVKLMLERHVRRIPLVEDSKVIGLVTLDDLIIDRTVDLPTLADIVRTQLSEPARHKDKGQLHPTYPVHPAPGH